MNGKFTILAVGKNEVGPAFMVINEEHGGWIFNASSMSFTGALQHDRVVDKIMLNLIEDATDWKR